MDMYLCWFGITRRAVIRYYFTSRFRNCGGSIVIITSPCCGVEIGVPGYVCSWEVPLPTPKTWRSMRGRTKEHVL